MRYDTLAFVAATLALAAAALFAGCDAAAPEAATSAALGESVLQFNADWTMVQSGALVAGSPALIRYAPERLPNCRAIYHGGPAWGIVASWNADGGFGQSAPVVQFQNGANVSVDASFRVPFGRDLSVWFFNSDEFGCTGYDSNYGRNFHFAIAAPPEPVIHFRSDWSQPVDGRLRAGAAFLVDYDLIRLPYCRASYNGLGTWGITAHARFDDGTNADAEVTEGLSSQRTAAPGRFVAPAAAHSVELWFENADRSSCRAWDSNYGRNYRFNF